MSRAAAARRRLGLVVLVALAVACSRHPSWFRGSFEDALGKAERRGVFLMVDFTADW